MRSTGMGPGISRVYGAARKERTAVFAAGIATMVLHSLPGGTMLNRSCTAALLLLLGACSDRTLTPPSESMATQSIGASVRPPTELARMVAKGLKNPAFRAYLKAQLD